MAFTQCLGKRIGANGDCSHHSEIWEDAGGGDRDVEISRVTEVNDCLPQIKFKCNLENPGLLVESSREKRMCNYAIYL
jgi:hypothetical protein